MILFILLIDTCVRSIVQHYSQERKASSNQHNIVKGRKNSRAGTFPTVSDTCFATFSFNIHNVTMLLIGFPVHTTDPWSATSTSTTLTRLSQSGTASITSWNCNKTHIRCHGAKLPSKQLVPVQHFETRGTRTYWMFQWSNNSFWAAYVSGFFKISLTNAKPTPLLAPETRMFFILLLNWILLLNY